MFDIDKALAEKKAFIPEVGEVTDLEKFSVLAGRFQGHMHLFLTNGLQLVKYELHPSNRLHTSDGEIMVLSLQGLDRLEKLIAEKVESPSSLYILTAAMQVNKRLLKGEKPEFHISRFDAVSGTDETVCVEDRPEFFQPDARDA